MSSSISKMTVIHENAKLGKDVTVSHFSSIADDVIIGDNCWIGPNVTIMEGARIGNNCRVFPGAVIAAIPQDLKFKGEYSTVQIGDNVTIRECVTVNRGTEYSDTTRVGNNTMLMAYVHLAHDCIIGENVILGNAVNVAGHVEINDFAIVSGMSAIHQFCKIGKHAFISGGSLVGKDVPPFVKAARDPLSYVGVNSVGLKRRGYTNDEIHSIQDIYRKLFVEDNNITQALNFINTEIPESNVREDILSFINSSDRGIMKGY